MPDRTNKLNLNFPTIPQGKNRTPYDLQRLLHIGGASMRRDDAEAALRKGKLGRPVPQRVALVRRIHHVIDGKLSSGGSAHTARTEIKLVESFFGWVEGMPELDLSISGVQAAYLTWADHLYFRNTVAKDITKSTAYTNGRCIGSVLDAVLERPTPMIELTRLREPKRRKSPAGTAAEKALLQSTFDFGRLLQDICDGLTLKVIWGPRPVRIPLRTGGELVHWMGVRLRDHEDAADQTPKKARITQARNDAYARDRTVQSRSPLINQRVMAEMLVFIGQTGMNLEQVNKLQLRHFAYSSTIEGYSVKDYKKRRAGEVLFQIFKDYRSHFDRYLAWRRALFPAETRLFPLIRRGAHDDDRPPFDAIQKACKAAGVDWLPPTALRGARINWILRRSGDVDLTADIAQHLKETTLRDYEVPSQHRAIGEIPRFWISADPALSGRSPCSAIAPGVCSGTPAESDLKPEGAPSPDCVHPSGCLWCTHHRDVDSLNHVWALASFRHLKVLELSKYCPPAADRAAAHPAENSIQRLSQKLAWLRDSNSTRRAWVEEAFIRIDEGRYHTDWGQLIDAIEVPAQ